MDQKEFSRLVARKRKQSGLTLHEFGETIGASWVTIWRWENEYCMPKKDATDYWVKQINAV